MKLRKILILNVGSSSVKYNLYIENNPITHGKIQKIGEFRSKTRTFHQAIEEIAKKTGDIDIIGHRVVHGGNITKPSLITPSLIIHLEDVSPLAPIHNHNQLHVIKYCLKKFKKAKQIALFDTNFFKDLPLISRTYPINKKISQKYNIRRYGFHGHSHKYLLQKAKKTLKKRKLNLITCHLGNGCSITAIKDSKPIDTSMGFTPLDGIPMGTRSGAIDPGIIFFLMRQGYLRREIDDILNEKSGLLGISGKSKDARDLQKNKSPNSKLALDIFTYQTAKQISAYLGILGKVNAIIFSGGIGYNEKAIRKKILSQIKIHKKTKILYFQTDEASVMINDILKTNKR